MSQKFVIFRLVAVFVPFLFSGMMIHCAGAGSGLTEGEAETNSPGSDESNYQSIFEGGPVDIPVPIAKAEAPDPKLVTVSISGNQITLTGLPGAIPNPTSCPQVWARDDGLGQEVTTSTNSDGSFDSIHFDYETADISTAITLAGYDGTNICTPVFLRISQNTYVWLMTNGATISLNALTMEDDNVYLVAETTSTGALVKNSVRAAATVSSCLYTLSVAGVAESVGCGDFTIDNVFSVGGQEMVRSGNSFYYPGSDKTFSLCCEIPFSETISHIDYAEDDDGEAGIVVATDSGLYSASFNGSSFTEIDTLDSGQSYSFMSVSESSFLDQVTGSAAVSNAEGVPVMGFTFDLEGNILSEMDVTSSVASTTVYRSLDADMSNNIQVNYNGVWYAMTVYKAVFQEGDASTYSGNFFPVTELSSSNTTTAGSDRMDFFVVYFSSSLSGGYYLLDGNLTWRTSVVGSGGSSATNYEVISLEKTRTVYDVEAHPSGQLAFFCAQDENANGQLYAFCPVLAEVNQTSVGDEVIQLTFGAEHCTTPKNWKVDTTNTNGSLVVVNMADPSHPQIQFIDPFTDPNLAVCF